MSCTSIGYIVQNGTRWKEQSSAEVTVQKKSAESHAERQAFEGFSNKGGPYLIVQDAFPCFDGCHQHFLNMSKSKPGKKKDEEPVPGSSVIIKVTADNTYDMNSYVQQGLISAKVGCFPWYIYYQNGTATFRMGIARAPQGFPVHPSPQNV